MRSLSTTVPFGFDFDTSRFLSAYRSLGCISAQFYRNPARPPRVADVLRTMREADMTLDSIHGVFGPRIDPSSGDADERAECLHTYDAEGRLALELGVSSVVVHPSANRADLKPYTPAEASALQEQRWPAFDDFLARLADIGERLGVTYLIENVPRHSPLGHDAIMLAEHLLAVRSPRIRMCFDTGHAHLTGELNHALEHGAPAIDYIHIHDNHRVNDDHLMPGDGSIGWPEVSSTLARAELDVPCMLEVFYPEERVESLCDGPLRGLLRSLVQGVPIRT